ncbi:ethanolamine utilization protein EutH [Geomicrobium sp. JSM 1781026]|uniref:ethanolamine utilization protein EutH n=1 Tax=Geomicrobium sp. JSM 1781026 TaxID=3344580 RepID=UPI0035BECB49
MMTINDVIFIVLLCSFIVAAVDYLLGSRLGLGHKFHEAFQLLGALMIIIVGITTIAPIIATSLQSIADPLYGFTGIEPAAVINTFIAIDMGGYALAEALHYNEDAKVFAWALIGTMYGPTIAFTVPVALGIIEKQDTPHFIRGILIGIMFAPIGCLAGGWMAGFSTGMMLNNLIPAIGLSGFIFVGLTFKASLVITLFTIIGKAVTVVAVFGLMLLAIDTLFVTVPNIAPLQEGMGILGQIVIVLAGAMPLVYVISKVLEKPLQTVGAKINLNKESSAGLLVSLAHAIPALAIYKHMNERGKVVVAAFCVAGAFIFGGHLGFVAGVSPEHMTAMMIGKGTAGLFAIAGALYATRHTSQTLPGK